MGFSEQQRRSLSARLPKRHIKTRSTGDTVLSFISAWHAISEANRIFGYDAWDRQTTSPTCLWTDRRQGHFAAMYLAKVRVTVRAGPAVITREGIGTGYGRSLHEDSAHEIAIKASETDATKRALATFGNPFGLSLYDAGKRGTPTPKGPEVAKKDLVIDLGGGRHLTFESKEDLAAGFRKQIPELGTLRDVYAFWERNLQSLIVLNDEGHDGNPVPALLEALKERGRVVARMAREAERSHQVLEPKIKETESLSERTTSPQRTPKTPLLKERRVRDKNHLRFVARHPCLVCGRTPAHAHHLKFAQPRAMAMKVSDEFTVPLCAIHHDELHRTGDEQAWWARHGIEPMKIAELLWRSSDKAELAELNERLVARAQSISDRRQANGHVHEPAVDPSGLGGDPDEQPSANVSSRITTPVDGVGRDENPNATAGE